MPFRACTVTFRDSDGVFQTAKVDAETTFEVAALALKFWSARYFVNGPDKRAVPEVEVDRPARMIASVKMSTLLDWLYKRKPMAPEEAARI
jgi:hypothetical protein